MTPAEKKPFLRLVADIHAYYRQPCTEFALTVWWEGCKEFDLELVTKALSAHATSAEKEGHFCPMVSDVVRQLQGTATDRAQLAWGKLHEAMARVGAYTDVVFDDPAIHAVVEDLGGWPKLCRMELKELGYAQHRFTEGYRAYVAKGAFGYPRVLGGDRSPDSDYAKRGLAAPTPTLVGDPWLCRATFDGGGDTRALITTSIKAADALEWAPRAEGGY